MILLLQIVCLGCVVETFVQFMPATLRRASKQNTFRLDGTVSENRVNRERRARNRLRMDLLAVFVLVFLTGNALYHTIELYMPVADVWHLATGSKDITTVRDTEAREKWAAGGTGIALLTALWVLGCCAVISGGVMRAYRSFRNGVQERSAENFHLDMTRMSINGSEFAHEVINRQQGGDRPANVG